ncbi:selenide, water dikinase, putative [Oceanicola granulosus HTCC2516]|uniref:Selenide, water dikinase, putative n=1 Tax=Oceanicola granulosus (strain ATCC BAA-861 / DSM 15982 / KCTC 12143 / HTCC2516) TaxID=314256 RepID=Q2CK67_OCEGH|nr:selenide, water dikinase, putative [Oceanicola granulosus HTCC2516]
MENHVPLTRDLVLIGGGHTHALVLRAFGMRPLPGVRLTLIDPAAAAAYSGMLPGFVAGHYRRDQLDIDLVRLARFAGARVILGRAEAIDRGARTVTVAGRPPVAYDVCSIDIGITSEMPDLPGFAEHAVPAKPLGRFASAWEAFRRGAERPRVAVVGGGVAGAELAMAVAHALRRRRAEVRLVDRGEVLDSFAPPVRARLLRALEENIVEVVEDADIAEVTAEGLRLVTGEMLAADFVIGAAGARPYPWLAETGLELTHGYVAVLPTLQSSDPDIFAAGDCAHLTETPRSKAGVYAVREAPVLEHNLRAALAGGPMRRYRPQRDYLKLISLGEKKALAERGGRALAGGPMWRWKDWIDRRFMAKLDDLPAMEAPLPPRVALGVAEATGDAPLCGGCGAKVGRGALGGIVSALPGRRDDVASRPGDDAAVLEMGGARQVVTVDHLRAVVDDPVLMTRIAAVHALGDVWAMGAAPQAVLASLVLPRMNEALQRRTLSEVMATAAEVFGAEGADIVGGHSSMGSEMTIGFTVTGLLERPAITLAGARPGDGLVLTKPIGTGVLLAAEMRGRAPGGVIADAYRSMVRPQGTSAGLLGGAHAMTDVTGFGLAGHLLGICDASGVGAELDLAAVPVLEGAERLAEEGVRSTIWAENRALAPALGAGGRSDLLYDPQTCGGLLAAVPDAEATVAALRAAGEAGWVIGRITEGPPVLRLNR